MSSFLWAAQRSAFWSKRIPVDDANRLNCPELSGERMAEQMSRKLCGRDHRQKEDQSQDDHPNSVRGVRMTEENSADKSKVRFMIFG